MAGEIVKETLKIGQGKAGPGRTKGVSNKNTTILKDAILQAAQEAGGSGGLVEYLKIQAMANPGPFLSLLGKVLPMQIDGSSKFTVVITTDDAGL